MPYLVLLLRAEETRVMAATRSAFGGTVETNKQHIMMGIYQGLKLK